MTRPQTPVVSWSLAIALPGLLPSASIKTVGVPRPEAVYPMTTTIHFSGLNTDPAFLIHLASNSRYRVCPQVSLLPCRLSFGRVGLGPCNPHPLGNISQFHLIAEDSEAPNLSRHDNCIVIRFLCKVLEISLLLMRIQCLKFRSANFSQCF